MIDLFIYSCLGIGMLPSFTCQNNYFNVQTLYTMWSVIISPFLLLSNFNQIQTEFHIFVFHYFYANCKDPIQIKKSLCIYKIYQYTSKIPLFTFNVYFSHCIFICLIYRLIFICFLEHHFIFNFFLSSH